MSKHISQETFDNVVKENMEEFEMTAEEAIEDAVKQFEAQGINLENIVKTLSLKDDSSEESHDHIVVAAIKALETCLKQEPLDYTEIMKQCDTIKAECNIDLSHRCLAASNNAYNVLFQATEKCQNEPEALLTCISALCALCNGQPDVLDMRGTIFFNQLLQNRNFSPETVSSLVQFIRFTCTMHESNRQAYVGQGLITNLTEVLETHKDNPVIVKEVCAALRVLTNDDDIRVPFGKAHDHAKMIVTEANALSKILRICKDYSEDHSVLGELFLTLARLAVRNEFCQEIMELGGLTLMLTALEKSISEQAIVIQALKVMKAIAGNDKVKQAIVKNDGAELILTAITKHPKHPAICEVGCAAIATIVLRNPEHCRIVMEAGGAEVLVKTLILHPSNGAVQKQACMAIRNLVARTRNYNQTFLDLGVEPLIQRAMSSYKDLHDEAKAALRDLDCKLEFNCPWTGTGRALEY